MMTDHYIQRRKPARDLLAQIPERRETDENAYRGEVVLYYPQTLPDGPDKDLYVAVAQVSQKTNLIAGIQQLAAAIAKYQPGRVEYYEQSWNEMRLVSVEPVEQKRQKVLRLRRGGFPRFVVLVRNNSAAKAYCEIVAVGKSQ